MGTAAWACFDCKTAVRRDTLFRGEVPCPNCGKPCSYLGYKIPVPVKSKDREWAVLRQQLAEERLQRELTSHIDDIRRRHELEKEITRLEAMPTNGGRAKAIRLLQKKLALYRD